MKPKLSIVTVVYNGADTIADTIASVAAQAYPELEYLVIDGASNDATLDRVHAAGEIVTRVVSEPDRGLYDAMNKGIALTTGEIVGLINADDVYCPGVFDRVVAAFADPEVDAVYGDLCYVRQNDLRAVVRYWKSGAFRLGSFSSGWVPPHPTLFLRREVYERCGDFDLSYRIAADTEFLIRLFEVHRIRARHLPEILVRMRLGGTTNRSLGNIVRQNREILRALDQHRLPASIFRLIGCKLLSRGWQFVARPPRS